MKKKFNLVLIAILVFIGIATIATSSASSNAPGSIQMGTGEQLEGYMLVFQQRLQRMENMLIV